MFQRKLAILVLALSTLTGASVGTAAQIDAQQQAPVSVQAGECEWC
ncbi:hypothetical protein ACGFJC_46660 [Nonomuraea fuscirosea]|jgi:hypothetical protein|uniref:Uncharacterized protein n=1 Tax=Nonomuraea fuscirosea TaxID=1291556 RepID=A0A2T0MZT5_9ACTN|nr:hypothetical protein [Nonomuraea fuscirosea]PRX64878.1 hypothetical protein B0I32_108239 [Nonomuraea fuscirosea]WSA52198.1 hypothetical protein OIE67_50590 [Nonomuraea fuscirosea]